MSHSRSPQCSITYNHPTVHRLADIVIPSNEKAHPRLFLPICRPCYRYLDRVITGVNKTTPGAHPPLPVITHSRRVGHA